MLDVLIIGGGIHGVGVAQAMAAAGFSTLLLERSHLAAGTSSRSSKLIHGGLRYLESKQLGLVRESLRERAILLEIAPSLVHRIPFYIPIYRHTRFRPWEIRAGLTLYALLAGFTPMARFHSVPKSRWNDLAGLRQDELQCVFGYWDAQTDDARLTAAVMRSAQELGAALKIQAQFIEASRSRDGYRVRYLEGNSEKSCACRVLINAGGPWVNRILDRITPCPIRQPIDLVQGSHVLLPGSLGKRVFYMEAPRDGRAVFVMPWNGNTLVGTTENLYEGDPSSVAPLPQEIDYLVETVANYFPNQDLRVLDSFAGLRVLLRQRGRFFNRPREAILQSDDPKKPHLITIYGGKLTGYRATAQDVLSIAERTLGQRKESTDTAYIRLEPEATECVA